MRILSNNCLVGNTNEFEKIISIPGNGELPASPLIEELEDPKEFKTIKQQRRLYELIIKGTNQVLQKVEIRLTKSKKADPLMINYMIIGSSILTKACNQIHQYTLFKKVKIGRSCTAISILIIEYLKNHKERRDDGMV